MSVMVEILTGSLDTKTALNEADKEGLTIWEKKAELAKLSSESAIESYNVEKRVSDARLANEEENTQRELELIAMKNEARSTFLNGWSELTAIMGAENKEFFLLSKALAGTEAGINSYLAFTKALAQGGFWGVAKASGILASGLAAQAKIWAAEPPKFANGGDFVTSGKQLIMVGDNGTGRERVQITPQGNETGQNITHVSIPVVLNGREMGRAITKLSADGQIITSSRSIR